MFGGFDFSFINPSKVESATFNEMKMDGPESEPSLASKKMVMTSVTG